MLVEDRQGAPTSAQTTHPAIRTDMVHEVFGRYAEDSLVAVCREIARLESLLSRFIPGSDISRINESAGVTSRASTLWTAFALGVSFGLGEAVYLAYSIARIPDCATLPWFAYTGYMGERIFTCFAHGVLTAVLVTGIQRSCRNILYGLLAAMGLHLLLSVPAALYQFELIPLDLYNISLMVPFIVLAMIFEQMRRAEPEPEDDLYSKEVIYWQRQTID